MPEGRTKPGEFAKAITASNTVDIDFDGIASATRAIYVGSGGDISVEMAGKKRDGSLLNDPTVVFIAVPTGTLLPLVVSRVNSTGTTASSLVAVW